MILSVPPTVLGLDFETYYSSEFNLRKVGVEPYVRDPRFEVLGVGVKLGGRPSVWMEEAEFRAWAARLPWGQMAVLAQHAHFEGLILSHHYDVRPGFWLDTLSMARALHGPGGPNGLGNSLGSLAAHYGVGVKGDELENMRGKRRCDFSSGKWLAAGAYCNNDNELTSGVYHAMRLPLFELRLIDATVRMFAEPVLSGDQTRLSAALAVELEKKRAVLEGVARMAGVEGTQYVGWKRREVTVEQAARKVLGSSPQLAKLLEGLGVDPPMKDGKNGRIYAFASTDPGMQDLLEHERLEVRALAEARIEVKSTIVGTRTLRFLETARRGPMPVYLKHAAAHTHRWSGGDSMNWQNLNRGGDLRAAIHAPGVWEEWMGEGVPGEPGALVVADSAQIEPRVTGWLAGEESLLATFRRNDAKGKAGDIYADEGSVFFRKPLSREKTPIERQVAKNMIIGLGYSMGGLKFGSYSLAGMNGADPVQFGEKECQEFGVDAVAFEQRPHNPRDEGGPTCGQRVREVTARIPYRELLIHMAVADHLVRVYRNKNKRIVALWKTMNSLLEVMATPGCVPIQFGPLRVEHERIVKPSGLALRYDKIRRTGDGYVYWGYKEGRMQWVKTYGGALTENVVQSLARDIVAEQLLRVVNAGYRLVMTTHDEGVVATSKSHGARCFELMTKAMKTPPAWCHGLPLNASGGVGRSYGAVK